MKAEPVPSRRAWPGDAVALLAGALLPLAYAPYGFFPLAVLLPATLFTLWLRVSPGRALWRGWLFGAGLFGAGVYWIYISIHQYGNAGVALAAVLTAGFIAAMALFPAVAGGLVNRYFPVAETLRLVLVMPAVWTLVEWVRGWFLTGFPWLDLGYSQAGTPLAVGVAPLLGVYGVSWVVALSAGLLVVLVRA
ncbi:MAG: apolipoprotein N-acyltransferase, partial [Gammaproteobacteria bacterium]|nr:apolipoprotein N-acyltransferase [Gammaproteobacteria bacterium]